MQSNVTLAAVETGINNKRLGLIANLVAQLYVELVQDAIRLLKGKLLGRKFMQFVEVVEVDVGRCIQVPLIQPLRLRRILCLTRVNDPIDTVVDDLKDRRLHES